jgi:hemerythrin superfamily protein
MTTTTKQRDVVDLLLQQHQEIKRMLTEIQGASGEQRKDRFNDLVRFLAVHETAEELVVHPTARDTTDEAKNVVNQRLSEEKQAKQVLAQLYDMGTDHPDFPARFSEFATSVIHHAEREEAEEFPVLTRETPVEKRQRMARMVERAESMAPTRPHPGVGESAAANLVAGPPLAVFDRVRDALRNRQDKND